MDGILDDETWKTLPLKKDFITYEPIYGEKLPYETLVWMTYDSKNLYFAFRCYDKETQKIKTWLTSRDRMWSDDWVGITLDSLGNKQTTYGFCINPNGIQGDLVESTSNPDDPSPDFVWESAGEVTSTGYQVEICIPLKSIRFESGKNVEMEMMFRRKISRLGVKASWPEQKAGQGVFNLLVPVRLKELKKPLKIEILPSITRGSNRVRIQPDKWNKSENFTEFGIGLKYGITSSITADITINPDFSQVENDAFQVEINQRYLLFFKEKRSFFMEGMDIFNFYTLSNGFFTIPVHTRLIVDPAWGAKITGSQGKMSFGILSAGDQWPGQQDALFGIARGKYSLGRDNYIGFLYSSRDFAGEYNRVLGVDFAYRPGKGQRFNISLLHSLSGSQEGKEGEAPASNNFNFYYNYDSTHYFILTTFEHIGTDFRMDTAYIVRNGINNAAL
ncbi:MAG: carbohydrate binding family 9 domain-containing protein [Candidatus Aminicenantes bacterium]|nr:MAG: carbohydrate binding family 9 domain-containing protein [Candidatus Aminicenantes bacterium]